MFPVDRWFTDDLPSKCLTMLASYHAVTLTDGIKITNGYPMVSKVSRHVEKQPEPVQNKRNTHNGYSQGNASSWLSFQTDRYKMRKKIYKGRK